MNIKSKTFRVWGGFFVLFTAFSFGTLMASNALADAAKGEKIFFGEDAECNSCHKMHGKGGSKRKKIPNLSNVGSMLSKDEIIMKVTNPCMIQAEGFRDEWEEEVMPRNFADLLSEDDIKSVAEFLSQQKETSVKTPKGIHTSEEDQEEYC